MTQQKQQLPRMGKTQEYGNGLKLGFLKTVTSLTDSFSKFTSAVYSFKNNAQGTICLSLIYDFVIYM